MTSVTVNMHRQEMADKVVNECRTLTFCKKLGTNMPKIKDNLSAKSLWELFQKVVFKSGLISQVTVQSVNEKSQ